MLQIIVSHGDTERESSEETMASFPGSTWGRMWGDSPCVGALLEAVNRKATKRSRRTWFR